MWCRSVPCMPTIIPAYPIRPDSAMQPQHWRYAQIGAFERYPPAQTCFEEPANSKANRKCPLVMCVTNDRNCLSTSAHRIATVAKTARKMIPLHASSAEVEIMYQDDDLLAVNKPGGTTTTPAHRHTGDSLLNRLIGESAGWPVCILAQS